MTLAPGILASITGPPCQPVWVPGLAYRLTGGVAGAEWTHCNGLASVDWLVTGAISLGASSTALGSMVSFGAITLGAMATSGALNAGGAITVGAGAVYVSVSSVGALTLGAGSHKVGEVGYEVPTLLDWGWGMTPCSLD
eukprot:gene32482-17719_t